MDHPASQVAAQAGAVGDAHLHAGHHPEVRDARGSQQRLAVGRVGDGAPDDLADAELLEQRHPLVGPRQPEADSVEVGGEQGALRRPVGPVDPGRLGAVLLVDADEARLLLLAHVARDVVVADHGQLVLQPGELLGGAGDEVAVQHVGQRRRQTHHPRHLWCVAAGGVDDMFGHHGAGLGDDVEAAVGPAVDLEHPVAAAEGGEVPSR